MTMAHDLDFNYSLVLLYIQIFSIDVLCVDVNAATVNALGRMLYECDYILHTQYL